MEITREVITSCKHYLRTARVKTFKFDTKDHKMDMQTYLNY